MENERIGLICAVLQNGIPVGFIKKGAKVHQPSEYFGVKEPVKKQGEPTLNKLEQYWNGVLAWAGSR